jgi:hypothetical protein
MEIFPATKQRAALVKLVSAVGCRAAALRRDECGDWRIEGSSGHVYAVPGTLDQPNRPGFMLYIMTGSPKAWTFAKRALAFAKVINDGDEEGDHVARRDTLVTNARSALPLGRNDAFRVADYVQPSVVKAVPSGTRGIAFPGLDQPLI